MPLPRSITSLLAAGLSAGILLFSHGVPAGEPDPGTGAAAAPEALLRIEPAQLSAGFWTARLPDADRVVMDTKAIAAQNAKLVHEDSSVRDLRDVPGMLSREQVTQWIRKRSQPPRQTRYGIDGKPIPAAVIDGLVDDLSLDTIPERQATRYGLVVRRADLRTFPTRLRVFSTTDDTDIDRFQESALFPGTPVVIAHASRDGQWWFVVAARYAAWIEADRVAEGDRGRVLTYPDKAPYRIVTGDTVRTVFAPGQPQLSELPLDMGVRIPLAEAPRDPSVNGQAAYTSYVLELPQRGADGRLWFAPALLPRNVDSAGDYLPLTKANIIRQAFKFLGERYGWGHAYDARDCSGFVSEVYRSMGVVLPRNTGDQAMSPALPHIAFDDDAGAQARGAAVAALQAGDMVYIPGHVMLVIGRIDGVPWVIHDIEGGRVLDAAGHLRELHLNSVAVTPLPPLLFDADHRYIDRITSIVHFGAPAGR